MGEYYLGRSSRRTARLWVMAVCMILLVLGLWDTRNLSHQSAEFLQLPETRLVFPVIEETLTAGNMLVETFSLKAPLQVFLHSSNPPRGPLYYMHRYSPQSTLHLKQDTSNWTDWRPELKNIGDYFRYLQTPQTSCRKLKRMGGTYACKKGQEDGKNMDGQKYVCMDPPLEVVGAKDARSCLALSFGIQHDTSFDEDVADLSCEVHMFDVFDFKPPLALENGIYFHVEGLARLRHLIFYDNLNKTVSVDTLRGHYLKHHLFPRPIHILKVDIENDEWESFRDIVQDPLFDAVGQVALEVHAVGLVKGPTRHSPPSVPREKWLQALQERYDLLRMIEARGFRRALYWDNVQENYTLYDEDGSRYETAGEVLYINTNWYNVTFKQNLASDGFKFREVT